MAKVVYLSTTGSDANSGLTSALPKLTFSGTRAALAAGDRVSIAAGTYTQAGTTTWSAATDAGVVYMPDGSGPVIVDFNNVAGTFSCTNGTASVVFVSIIFMNPNTASRCITGVSGSLTPPRAFNCVFFHKISPTPLGGGTSLCGARNCTYFNLATGYFYSGGGVTMDSACIANYFKTCTTPITESSDLTSKDFNAFPGNTENYGIDTSLANSDPGFVVNNLLAAFPNFRISPTDTVAFTKLRTLGPRGTHIGATGGVGPYYNAAYLQLRMISPNPTPTTGTFPAWEDDPSYTATGVLGAVIQDPTSGALVLDLETTPTATDGRIRSDVFDSGTLRSWTLRGIILDAQTDIRHGSAVDTNTTLPTRYEFRGSASSFAKADVSPAWESVKQDEVFSRNYRYMQFRLTLRRDHTNV